MHHHPTSDDRTKERWVTGQALQRPLRERHASVRGFMGVLHVPPERAVWPLA
jgi:hypothetical protein